MQTLQFDFGLLLRGEQSRVGVGEVGDAIGNLVNLGLGHLASFLENVDLRPKLFDLATQHGVAALRRCNLFTLRVPRTLLVVQDLQSTYYVSVTVVSHSIHQ